MELDFTCVRKSRRDGNLELFVMLDEFIRHNMVVRINSLINLRLPV